MKEGVRQGGGTCTYKDGSVYVGQWHMGVRQGEGTLKAPSQGMQYTGSWNNDMMHGKGTMFTGDEVIEARWVDGKLNGRGTIQKGEEEP